MIVKGCFFVLLVGLWSACSQESEKKQLELRLKLVRSQVEASRRDVEALLEMGQLMDSIDRNRFDVLVDWREEPTPVNKYKFRLRAINQYVQETELRIHYLEGQIDRVPAASPESAKLIAQLKKRIAQRSREVNTLKEQFLKYTRENQTLYQQVSRQDATLDANEVRISEQDQKLEELKIKVEAARDAYQSMKAEALFVEAVALESLAQRTHFAAAKKREAQEQALKLYREALALGNEEARSRIEELEKEH